MLFLQAVRLSFEAIWSNKLRSFLTMLGVIIGVFAVVALVSIGQGATATVTEQVEGMGANLITVNILGRGTQTTLSLEEALALGNRAGIEAVAPLISNEGTIKAGNNSIRLAVVGSSPEYQVVRNHYVQTGRFITSTDINYRQKIAVIGTEVESELFPYSNPIGQEIRIDGNIFTVVGVMEEKDGAEMTGGASDNTIIIPVSTALRLFQSPGVRTIYLQAESPESTDRAAAAVEATLKYQFKDEDAYQVINQAQILDLVNEVTGTLTIMLGGIAGISLLVGGIGIMNIMLVSVTERTREIGICKALGAKRRDILYQFVVESAVISSLGGIIGVALGYGVVSVLSRLVALPAAFSLQVVVTAMLFSLFVGLFFGIYPANKAAKLNPIDALRAE
jgi:putative ABC transport system permease protein